MTKQLQSNKVRPPFGEFADKSRYNGHIPTGRYLAHVYKQHHKHIRCYLDQEVKKRGADVLYWDVSYKICKLLCQYQGEAVFKGYVTALNEVGEIRVQFYIHTDSHSQMMTALRVFKQTNAGLGLNGPRLFVTDNPSGDKQFFMEMLDLVQKQQLVYDSLSNDDTREAGLPYINDDIYDSAIIKTITMESHINEAINIMYVVMKNPWVGLDTENPVSFNGGGYIIDLGKVSLIQIWYMV